MLNLICKMLKIKGTPYCQLNFKDIIGNMMAQQTSFSFKYFNFTFWVLNGFLVLIDCYIILFKFQCT